MNAHLATALYIALTLIAYACVRRLYVKYNHPLFNVVALSAAVVIVALVVAGIPYEAYLPAKEIMTAPIGAATVALALPLYRHRAALRCAAMLRSLWAAWPSARSWPCFRSD